MRQFEFIVQSKVGIHARPALLLSEKAKEFPCRIWAEYKGRQANVKNVIKLMGLAVPYQETVTFFLEGEQEDEAAEKLKEYCVKNL